MSGEIPADIVNVINEETSMDLEEEMPKDESIPLNEENKAEEVRRQSLIRYISAFTVLNIPSMAKVFKTETNDLMNELIELIDLGMLEARIDLIEEKLYRFEDDPVAKNSRRIAEIHQDLQERIKALIIRASLSYHGVNGVNPNSSHHHIQLHF